MTSNDQLLPWEIYLLFGILLLTYIALAFTRRLPSIQAFKDFADTVNSAGGHILLLSAFTFISIRIAMKFLYRVMELPGDMISKDQATISVGISFVTGTLAGTFIGALLKTMSGGRANGDGTAPAGTPDTLTASVVPPEGKK
jgi:hypothetical protein